MSVQHIIGVTVHMQHDCIKEHKHTQIKTIHSHTICFQSLNLLDVGQARQTVMQHVQQGVQDGV